MAKSAAKERKNGQTPAAPREVNSFVRYADYLDYMIDTAPKRTKGERTKDKLKFGAIQVLDDVGYHAMRVSDICEAAGVAAATFYLYFDNKEQVTQVVLAEYLSVAMKMMAVRPEGKGPFEAIRASHLKWLEVTYANAGLMRCILQLGDEVEDFRDLAHAVNKQWYERIAQAVLRDQEARGQQAPNQEGALPLDVALLSAYALGSMMDELARKLVIHPDPALLALTGRTVPDKAELADFLAVLWYQALYGQVPRDLELADAATVATRLVGRAPG
ncbi:TetR/AcrR family transcriptional regulator [Sandaracinobacter sp. RS1-74]|uniref:TetR/AcrR family transcriptional regulator n=1 Tax=Sandaracinobacteroides sayramensis TaxID=2913411 RepID=UPI001EDC314F|nr:TetR/AcrR family transcriptional regulator [Sandaracinobacteroides sayramensis]MCG2840638.1 TetR/AcrR family transcriptional regulator [Sandaracinobacteroides sayramensis]